MLLARAAVPGMRERGRGAVVNVASLLAFAGALPPDPLPYRAVYAGTKGFVVVFSRTLAAELAGTGVQVQVVCPGYTTTEFHRAHGLEPVAEDAQDLITVRSRRWPRPTWPGRRWRRWAPARWSASRGWPTPRPSRACWSRRRDPLRQRPGPRPAVRRLEARADPEARPARKSGATC